MTINFLELKNFDLLSQLEIEEAIVKADLQNWCIVNIGSPRYIVMGISNKPSDLLNLSRVEKEKIKIIKRFSGGGTVIVDEDTIFVTFIFSKSLLPYSFPEEIYKWTDNFYNNVFNSSDFSRKESDYVLLDKKCSGNAQYIKKNRWLHHSTFLWDYKIQNMDFLKIPPTSPSYRKNRDHKDFLGSINQCFFSKNIFVEKIKTELMKNFNIEDGSLDKAKKLLEKNYNKSTKLIS